MNGNEALSWIIDEVIRRLEARRKNALVIFTGAAIGYQESVPQLKALLAEGWNFRILLSNSAEYVLTPELIKEQLRVKDVYLEREVKGLKPLYQDIGQMIIPTLTLNTAVKVALGITDTLTTNVVAHGLMEGIPIIAAKDGCDLKNPTRLQMGMDKTPMAYLTKMEQHLSSLESYGIRLVEARDLYSTVAAGQTSTSPSKKSQVQQSIYTVTKRVLSRADVVEAKSIGNVLQVPPATIITSLARDTAKELDIRIIQE